MKTLKRIKQIFAGLVVFFLLQALFCVSDITGSAISFYEYGIDVSSYQGEIDWAQLKTEDEKLSFAIIRGGTTNRSNIDYQEDRFFSQNYEQAKACDWKVGVYFYCSAATEAEFQTCVDNFLNTLDGREVDYPVFIDIEQSQTQMDLGVDALTDLILQALEKIQDAGYIAGIYLGYSWIDTYVDLDRIIDHHFEAWMARYPYAEQVAEPLQYDYSDLCSIWQYSDHMEYLSTQAECTDDDISYIDYANQKRLENDAEIGIPYLRPTKTLYYDTERMMRSSGVKWLQYCLNQYGGFHLTVDGKFGAGTQKALMQFQEQQNLTADGICNQELVAELVKMTLEQRIQAHTNRFDVDYLLCPDGTVLFRLPSAEEPLEAYTVQRFCPHGTITFNDTESITADTTEKNCCHQYYYDISVYPFTEKDVMLCVDLEDETHQSAYRLQQLQNFLLNRGISDTWETMQYDYNADGTINVLDLMLLKKILNQSL